MGRVLVLGALHLDVVVRALRLPALDETLMGDSVAYVFGGKGGNQAVAAARMGAAVSMAGRVGKDGFAMQIRAALDAAGVDHAQVLSTPGASGMSVAILEAGGDYGAVVVSGVNRLIDGAGVAIPADTAVVVLQNEIPEAANLALVARLPAGVFVILNAAPARAVPRELLVRVDLLVVNRVEAAQMAGEGLTPEAAALRLLAMGARAVIVTLGGKGAVIAGAAPPRHLPAHRVKVQSTHGAGDAFVGALAARLADGDDLFAATGFAQAAAALHVSLSDEARATTTPDQVRQFLNHG